MRASEGVRKQVKECTSSAQATQAAQCSIMQTQSAQCKHNQHKQSEGNIMQHISWSFLDKRKATMAAIEAYGSMKFIIDTTGDKVAETRAMMSGSKTQSFSGVRGVSDPQSGEARLLAGIDKLNVLEQKYLQAVEYMNWFKPAWYQLKPDYRYILAAFYMSDEPNFPILMKRFQADKNAVYRKKNRALAKLTEYLYGE